jgi:DNA-directed RNA polymerase I and III subunit RPAC2
MSLEEPVQDIDVSMQDEQEDLDTEKIKILPGATEDGTAASFQITEEDHTLGNALRYIIMKK